jgi:hypothetical protein
MIKLSDANFKLIIFIAFAANLILRLYKIDLAPLSYDESITAKDTMLDFGHIKHEAEWDSNPPFYHYCMWIWAKVFGISAFAMRSFSVLLCSITMLIVALFLKRNFSATSSLLFVLTFSLHPIIFYYSQEARSYCLIMLLSSLTLICFKHFLDSPSFKYAVILGLLNFLLIYTHYITFFIPLFLTLVVVCFERQALKWFTISALLSFALVFLRFTKGQFQLILGTSPNSTSRAWLRKANMSDLLNFMTKMYFHYILFIAIAVYLSYVIYKHWDSIGNGKRYIQFLWFISIFTPFAFFLMGLVIPIFVDRYILFSIMFSLIFLSISINYSKLGYILLIPVAICSCLNLEVTYVKDFDMRAVANYVHSHQQNRTVIIHTSDLNGLFTYYYDPAQYLKMDKDGHFDLRNKKIFTARDLEDFKQLPIQMENEIMLFQGYDSDVADKELYSYFRSNGYSISNINGFYGLKYLLLKKASGT